MKNLVTILGILSISFSVFAAPKKCLTDAELDAVVAVVKNDLQKNDFNSQAQKLQGKLKSLVNPSQLSRLEAYDKAIGGPDKLTLAKTLVDSLQATADSAFGGNSDCHEEDTNSTFSNRLSWSCNKTDQSVMKKIYFSTNEGSGFFTAGVEKHVGASKMPAPVSYGIYSWYSERYGKVDAENRTIVDFLIPFGNEDFSGSSNAKKYRVDQMDAFRKDLGDYVNYQCQQ